MSHARELHAAGSAVAYDASQPSQPGILRICSKMHITNSTLPDTC